MNNPTSINVDNVRTPVVHAMLADHADDVDELVARLPVESITHEETSVEWQVGFAGMILIAQGEDDRVVLSPRQASLVVEALLTIIPLAIRRGGQ